MDDEINIHVGKSRSKFQNVANLDALREKLWTSGGSLLCMNHVMKLNVELSSCQGKWMGPGNILGRCISYVCAMIR